MNSNTNIQNSTLGILSTVTAFIIWGLLPFFWRLLDSVPANLIIAYRIFWTLIFTIILIAISKRWQELFSDLKTKKEFFLLGLRAFFLAANWLTYIWGINHGYVIECSLGYFMTPLAIVFLGFLVLGEKLNKLQVVAVLFMIAGLLNILIFYGSIPLVSLGITITFATYALLKKTSKMGSLPGLTVEVGTFCLPAIIYIILTVKVNITYSYLFSSIYINFLLAVSGICTATPLLCYAYGVKRISFSLAGIIQYITPTILFFLGIFVYDEKTSFVNILTFILIWIGISIYCFDLLKE